MKNFKLSFKVITRISGIWYMGYHTQSVMNLNLTFEVLTMVPGRHWLTNGVVVAGTAASVVGVVVAAVEKYSKN